jgi:hypothetical protein
MLALFLVAGMVALGQRVLSLAGWQTDMQKREMQLEDIITVAERDEVMAIHAPIFASPENIDWLSPQSPLIVIEHANETRAYPLAVLLYHEVVNDTFQGVPIAVTFCPMCNSAIVYIRQVENRVLNFGVSGKVRHSGFIMWDKETESWWQQFTGKAIMGMYTGTMLEIMPAKVVSLGVFAEYYPDGKVLIGDADQPWMMYGTLFEDFIGYDSRSEPFYYETAPDTRLPAMERVLAAVIHEQPVAYPFGLLAEQRVINDSVQGMPVVAFWQPGAASVLDHYSLSYSRDVGMAVLFYRDLDGQTLTFYAENGIILDKETGSEWTIFGKAIAGELAGSALMQPACFPHFWFAWANAHPNTLVYGGT